MTRRQKIMLVARLESLRNREEMFLDFIRDRLDKPDGPVNLVEVKRFLTAAVGFRDEWLGLEAFAHDVGFDSGERVSLTVAFREVHEEEGDDTLIVWARNLTKGQIDAIWDRAMRIDL